MQNQLMLARYAMECGKAAARAKASARAGGDGANPSARGYRPLRRPGGVAGPMAALTAAVITVNIVSGVALAAALL